MGKRRESAHDLPLRRYETLCNNLLRLRREHLVRPATEREIGLIAEWEYERVALRKAWPAIAFGRDRPAPREANEEGGAARPKEKKNQSKSAKKKYVHDPTAFRRDEPRRHNGREIYATGRITVVGGGLPETRHR